MSDEEIADVVEVGSAPTEEKVSEAPAPTPAKQELAEGEEAQSQAPEDGESEEKDSDTDKGKESDAVQRRINKITAEKYELRRQLEEKEKRLKEFEQSMTPQKEPTLDDPDINYDQDKLVEKIVSYRLQQKQTTTQPQVDPVKAEKVATFSTKLSDFRKEAPDYDDVVKQMPIGQNASDAILEMDNGPAVAYYLAKHLDVVDELNSLSPVAATLRVQELSRKLQPASPKISQAPEPVESVKNGGGKVTKNTDEMSVEELDRYEEEQYRLRTRR